MAEVTGNIGNEEVILNNAATELTLKQLVAEVKSMANKVGKSHKHDEAQLKKFYENLKSANKEILKSNAQLDREIRLREEAIRKAKEWEEEEEETEKKKKAREVSISKSFKNLSNAVGTTVTSMLSAGDSLTTATSAMKGIMGAVPLIGGALGMFGGFLELIAGAVERTSSSFIAAASVGATFNGEVSNLISSASKLGLTFDQYAVIIQKNGEGLALMGGTVAFGSQQFTRVGAILRREVVGGLASLGYTTEGANQAMAGYISRLARTGHVQGRSVEDLAESSKKYLVNLDALSKLTGKSKDQLQAEADALQNQAKFRSLLARTDAGTRDQLEQLMKTIPEGMRSGAMEVLATGTATTEAGRQFLAYMSRTGQEFLLTGERVRRGGQVTAEQSERLFETMRDEAGELARSPLGQTLAMFREDLNDFMVAAFNIERMTTFAEARSEAETTLREAAGTTATSLEAMRQSIAETTNSLNQMMIRPEFVNLLTTSIETFTSGLQKMLGKIQEYMDIFNKDGVVGVLKALASDLWDGLKYVLYDWLWVGFKGVLNWFLDAFYNLLPGWMRPNRTEYLTNRARDIQQDIVRQQESNIQPSPQFLQALSDTLVELDEARGSINLDPKVKKLLEEANLFIPPPRAGVTGHVPLLERYHTSGEIQRLARQRNVWGTRLAAEQRESELVERLEREIVEANRELEKAVDALTGVVLDPSSDYAKELENKVKEARKTVIELIDLHPDKSKLLGDQETAFNELKQRQIEAVTPSVNLPDENSVFDQPENTESTPESNKISDELSSIANELPVFTGQETAQELLEALNTKLARLITLNERQARLAGVQSGNLYFG